IPCHERFSLILCAILRASKESGGDTTTALLSIITNLIYQCGVNYAGVPSSHGSYEAPVPAQLCGKE
ncbi:MAG: hypothetical protein RR696_15545, partial [Clostridia bacterium]